MGFRVGLPVRSKLTVAWVEGLAWKWQLLTVLAHFQQQRIVRPRGRFTYGGPLNPKSKAAPIRRIVAFGGLYWGPLFREASLCSSHLIWPDLSAS